jgi:diguanylate cyclase (GGDEF)-like protein
VSGEFAPWVDLHTGAYVRTHFEGLLADAVRRAHRERTPLVLLRLDVDDLQEHNDLHGQGSLDTSLSWLAVKVSQVVNGRGPLGRLGGDDFVLLLAGVPLPDALRMAEEVRRAAARTLHASPFGDYRLTLSVGVAALRPSEPWGNLLDAAERALVRAKQAGRDTVALR